MARGDRSIWTALLAGSVLAGPALAADVTPQRLVNADKEPQNWLMNHRTYDGQRFSPLARIDKGNVKGLKLAYTVALGGGAANQYVMATPLAEDGFLYITDSAGVLYKIDGSSGDVGRIVWRMDPGQQHQQRNRGAAFWGNLVITAADDPPRIVATNKDTGRVVWETGFPDTPDVAMTSAPLAIKDKIIVGAANGDQGVRDWMAGLDAATGKLLWRKFTIPAPGEPGIPTLSNCEDISIDTTKHSKEKGWNGGGFKTTERYESNLTAVDPVSGDIKKTVHLRYPNYSGALSTGGGLVFNALLDGTIAAFDDTTLHELWKFNTGSGISAPPMTFEVNGRQYVAI